MEGFDQVLIQEIDINESQPVLVFARGGRKNRYKATRVPFQKDVEKEIRDICQQTLARMRSSVPQPYDPDAVEDPESFIYIPVASLLDPTLIEVLSEGPSIDALEHDEELQDQFCYAAVYGPADDPVAIFIKKSNPIRVPRATWFARRLDNTLTKIDRAEITFYDHFDAVVIPGRFVTCWTVKSFEALFKTEEIVQAHTTEWIRRGVALADGLIQADVEGLVLQARSNSFYRNKWHALSAAESLSEESKQNLLREIQRLERDGSMSAEGGKLIVNRGNVETFFGLINEDDYTGSITGTRYRSQHKKRLS